MPALGARFSSSPGRIVAEQVASVIGEPQLARGRVPVEAHGIADAAREDLEPGSIRSHSPDGVVGIAAIADVARRADGHIQHAVRAEADELPSVMPIGWKLVDDDRRRPRAFELRLDLVETEHAVDLGDIQRTVPEGDAVWHVRESADDGDDAIGFAVLVPVGKRVHIAGIPRADEDRAARTLRQGAGVGNPFGEHGDLKTWWKLDFLELDARRRASSLAEHDRRRSRNGERWRPRSSSFSTHSLLFLENILRATVGRL